MILATKSYRSHSKRIIQLKARVSYTGIKIVLAGFVVPSIVERDRVLGLLEQRLPPLSKLYRDSHISKGRGALVLHTSAVERNLSISDVDYNKKNESLDLFDRANSRSELRKLIDTYDPTTEGILILISESSATRFVTVKLRPF